MKKQIRKCKYCGSETAVETGMHNWKNLFRKPTLEDYITLFIIIMVIFSYYQYKVDINNMIEYYEGGDYCWNQQLKNQENNINPSIGNALFQIDLSKLDSLDESNG